MAEVKSAKNKYRRSNKKKCSRVEALNNAQKIVFAPFTFQTVAAMLDLGILKHISECPSDIDEIIAKCNVSKYTVLTLLQAAYYADIVEKKDEKYSLTLLGECFLNNEMTINNFNFMRDICYLGANELTQSFKEAQPWGLKKHFINAPTIYPHVPDLPANAKKSWYDFDHYYSDDCFDEVLKIIFTHNPQEVFDIGGNTGKFEKACLEFNKDCRVNIIDLPVNKEISEKNVSSERMTFHGLDILSDDKLPALHGAVLMSQFLDCFSENQVVNILKKVKNSSQKGTRIYILEPLMDNQEFSGAAFAIAHISLYFTCMANGCSKMYTEPELVSMIEQAGLEIENKYTNIGIHCYTLLECVVR